MDRHFSQGNTTLLETISCFSPTSKYFMNYEKIKLFADFYGCDTAYLETDLATARRMAFRAINQNPEKLKTMSDIYCYLSDFKEAVPDTNNLLHIALNLPPTSAMAERSFS